jgi:tRNA pseudouridine55 synthase
LLDGPAAIVENADGTTDAAVRVHCSSGTYIRQLAHDIGERLQIGAHLVALRRESVGPHHVGQAVPLEILERLEQPDQARAFLLSPVDAIKHMPKLEVTEDERLRIRNGRQLELDRVRLGSLQPGEVVGLCDRSGELQAVGELMGEPRVLKLRMVLTV